MIVYIDILAVDSHLKVFEPYKQDFTINVWGDLYHDVISDLIIVFD